MITNSKLVEFTNCYYPTTQVTPNKTETNSEIVISPTYSNDISVSNASPVEISVIRFNDSDGIKEIESEMGMKFRYIAPSSEKFHNVPVELKNDLHVYDIGSLSGEMGIPLGSTKIVSQVNETGQRSYICSLKGGGICEIKLHITNSRGDRTDKPLDATTFKNTVLKAIKMLSDSNSIKNSITGENGGRFSNILDFDSISKTADFSGFIKRSSQSLNDIIQRYRSSTNSENITELNYIVESYKEKCYKMIENIL